MNAIAKIPTDDARLIDIMRDSLYPGAKPESVGMVLAYCRARGLDPLRKPVHIVPMYVKPAGQKGGGSMQDVVMPGIALYRIEAARTGEYAGKTEPVFGPEMTREWENVDYNGNRKKITVTFPAWCSVTVSRIVAGQSRDFAAREFWLENYATAGRDSDAPNAMWAKRAYGQLAKCAEAQALRMAFPEATGGEPTAEEMEGKVLPPREVPNLNQQADPPARPLAAAIAAAQETLPIIAPSGDVHAVPPGRWLVAVGKALAGLEDAEAVRVWRQSMGQHIAAVCERDDAMAMEADRMISERIEALTPAAEPADADADDSWPGPKA